MTRYKQKTEFFLVTRPPTCWKFDSCFWFVRKEKKDDKSGFVIKSVGIIVMVIFWNFKDFLVYLEKYRHFWILLTWLLKNVLQEQCK